MGTAIDKERFEIILRKGQSNTILTPNELETKIKNAKQYIVEIDIQELREKSCWEKFSIKKTFKSREKLIEFLSTPFGTKKNFLYDPKCKETRYGIYLNLKVNKEDILEVGRGELLWVICYFTAPLTEKEIKEYKRKHKKLAPKPDTEKNKMVYNYVG